MSRNRLQAGSYNNAMTYTRREILGLSGKAALAGALASHVSIASESTKAGPRGALIGDLIAAKAGEKMFAAGGNAIDAAIAAAFAAGIC